MGTEDAANLKAVPEYFSWYDFRQYLHLDSTTCITYDVSSRDERLKNASSKRRYHRTKQVQPSSSACNGIQFLPCASAAHDRRRAAPIIFHTHGRNEIIFSFIHFLCTLT